MTLPIHGFAPCPVGTEGGAESDLAVLETPARDPWLRQDMRWCVNCGGKAIFVPVYEIEQGRVGWSVGYCLGCGEERVVGFSRTNSEAA